MCNPLRQRALQLLKSHLFIKKACYVYEIQALYYCYCHTAAVESETTANGENVGQDILTFLKQNDEECFF